MKILVFNEQTDLQLDPQSVEPVVKYVLAAQRACPDEMTVYFVSEPEIIDLHEEFFDDPTTTDCISFPIDQSFLGEIFVCPKVACDRLLTQSEELTDNPYQETTLYLVHALLHLLGFDDINPADRQKMETRQQELMEQLIQKNLLLSP